MCKKILNTTVGISCTKSSKICLCHLTRAYTVVCVCTVSFTSYFFLWLFDFIRAYLCLRSHRPSWLDGRKPKSKAHFFVYRPAVKQTMQHVHTPGKLNVTQRQYTWLPALLLPQDILSIHSTPTSQGEETKIYPLGGFSFECGKQSVVSSRYTPP